MNNNWKIDKKITAQLKKKFPEINPIILQLLFNRGLKTQKDIDEFLLPDYSQDIHDPFIFKDMIKAVNRIYQGIKKKEKIVIYGDFDTDGITSTIVLKQTFKKIGGKNISTYIPDRNLEGYSLNKEIIEKFAENKVDLIVTCDCGITSVEEVNLANKKGIEVIVTDHHCESKKLPNALAIINSQLKREKYPFKSLAGVGVAFKLVQALLRDSRCPIKNKEAYEKWLLDLVALGTVADYMPLLGENRTLVKYGLIVLNKTSNLGIRKIIEKSNLFLGDLDTNSINFQLSPRLNAAARIKHADEAIKLLINKDKEKADQLADRLNEFNKKRQKIVEKIYQEVKNKAKKLLKERVLVILGKDWPTGILGLVASKTLEEYYRPVIILSENQGKISGSGRSISCFNIHEALSKLEEKYFLRFGGHAGAIGLALKSVDDFENFKKDFLKIAEEKIDKKDLVRSIKIDAEVNLNDINWELYDQLSKFEPFGRDNWRPNFLAREVPLQTFKMVGKNSQHCRLLVGNNKKMIYFKADNIKGLKSGDYLDIIFQLGVNQWNGKKELQIKVVDLKKSF